MISDPPPARTGETGSDGGEMSAERQELVALWPGEGHFSAERPRLFVIGRY